MNASTIKALVVSLFATKEGVALLQGKQFKLMQEKSRGLKITQEGDYQALKEAIKAQCEALGKVMKDSNIIKFSKVFVFLSHGIVFETENYDSAYREISELPANKTAFWKTNNAGAKKSKKSSVATSVKVISFDAILQTAKQADKVAILLKLAADIGGIDFTEVFKESLKENGIEA